jgi:hypothetical protein
MVSGNAGGPHAAPSPRLVHYCAITTPHAVCGRARQGKSFILNQLLGASGGFKVGPTVRPCTKGLWMWSAPVKRKSPDGNIYHLVCICPRTYRQTCLTYCCCTWPSQILQTYPLRPPAILCNGCDAQLMVAVPQKQCPCHSACSTCTVRLTSGALW